MSRGKITNLVGQNFGKLTVIRKTDKRVNGSIVWLCECSCVNKTVVEVNSIRLNSKNTQSCGCYQKEQSILINTKHGACKSSSKTGSDQLDYIIWSKILQRCYNKNLKSYVNYGGRGIKIHKSWRKDFTAFARYIRTLENCPDEEILISRLYGQRIPRTIDRINNDGNYEPGNLKWSTKREQANNRNSNKIIKYKGHTLTLAQAVNLYTHDSYDKVHQRIHKYGWSVEKAISTGSRLRRFLK